MDDVPISIREKPRHSPGATPAPILRAQEDYIGQRGGVRRALLDDVPSQIRKKSAPVEPEPKRFRTDSYGDAFESTSSGRILGLDVGTRLKASNNSETMVCDTFLRDSSSFPDVLLVGSGRSKEIKFEDLTPPQKVATRAAMSKE